MVTVNTGAGKINACDNLFIMDPRKWSPEWMQMVADYEGITITKKIKGLVGTVQLFYHKKRRAPSLKEVRIVTGLKLKEIYNIFPSGPIDGLLRMAGISSKDISNMRLSN